MISGTQLRVGMTIVYNGAPHKVTTVKHLTPGNKRGFVQTKLRSLITGTGFEHRFRSDDKVERAMLEQHEMEYLYSDDGKYFFMNTKTYEQLALSDEMLGDNLRFLTANLKMIVEYYGGKPVGVEPPRVVSLKVTDTQPKLKGATAASSYKPATLETGLVINVPPFIESGEVVRVDTVECKYLERDRS